MSRKSFVALLVLFVTAFAGCAPVPVAQPAAAPTAPVAQPAATATPAVPTVAPAKPLRLIAPDLAQPLEGPVEVRWEGASDVAAYRVVVTDMGTSELLFQQDVTGTSVTVPGPFKAGRGYSLGVHGLDASGAQVAVFMGEFMAAGTAVSPEDEPAQQVPANCFREGLLTYFDRDAGICFAYPQGFAFAGPRGPYAAGSQAQAELRGPAIGAGPEPLFARLSVEFRPYQGVDLGPFVDEMIEREVPADLSAGLERAQATWGGRAVEILEPWPGRLSARLVVVDVSPAGYHILNFWPSLAGTPAGQLGADAAQAEGDMEALYDIVSETFATLPPPGVPMDPASRLDVPRSCLVDGQPLYVDVRLGYCFALSPEMAVAAEADGRVGFYGPALDEGIEPIRVEFDLAVEDASVGSALAELVDATLASHGDLAQTIGRRDVTVGGEPAVRLDGVPGQPASIEILMLRGGRLFRFRFAPDMGIEGSQNKVDDLVRAITSSFGYLAVPVRVPTPAPEAALIQAGPYRGVSFSFPATLARAAEGLTSPAEGSSDGPWWGVSPERVEFRLEGYAVPDSLHEPRVVVYDVAAFAAVSPQAAEQIAALREMLKTKPENPEGQLPFLPLINAGQQMHLRVRYLAFKSGEGVSFVTQLAQGLVPVNNAELFYTFQGLTGDGNFYVSAILPVSNPALPDTVNDVPAAQIDALLADFSGYMNEVTGTLSTAPDTSFNPALLDLDALARSIEIAPGPLSHKPMEGTFAAVR